MHAKTWFNAILWKIKTNLMDVLKQLFEQHFHAPATRIHQLQGELGGSGRKIIRLANDTATAIGILYNVREENVAFLEFSRHFHHHGLPVPEIYGEDLNHGAYLEEDFGDTSLFEFLSKHRTGDTIAPAVIDAYRKVVAVLPRFQVEAGRDLNYKICYPRSSFDRQSIAWDLNYFKYYFLRLAGIPFSEQALEDDFSHLTKFLLSAPHDYFLYRDFQSRNIMLRIMQALGAYGFRGFYERKVHFLQSVPYALKNLRWLLHNVKLPIALPTLLDAFNSMLASEKLQALASDADNLVVRIFSFSFHRGWPKDETGNGGGFVFDGRSLPNPGREERFKALTGRDAPVIEYLNQQESVHQFFASVLSLVDASVTEYQRRNFKNLMVSFGCTGGQHRSVYLAEQLAKRLRNRPGLEVVVHHRELENPPA